jgi:flagellar motor protein MotB
MKPILLSTALAVAMGLSVAHADDHGSVEDMKAALEKSEAQVSTLQESLKSLAAARNKLFNQVKTLQLESAAERERLNATVNNLAADRNKLFNDYRGEQSKASAIGERRKKLILSLYDTRDGLKADLADAQKQLAAAKEKSAADAERMQDHILGLYDMRDSLKEQLAVAKAETTETSESLNAKIASGADAQEGLIDQLIELRNSSDEKITDAESRIAALETELSDAQRQNRVLTNVNNSTRNMMNSARSQLQAAQEQIASASSAESGGSSAWADGIADTLRSKVGSLAGTEVNTPGGDTVKVRVGNNGLFDSGGIALSDNGKQVLWVIGDALETVEDTRIIIEGHTDSRPVSSSSRFANNWELSFARASSALAHLRTNVGIPPERMSVAGASDKFPIADNDSAAGREQNRRVEIVLTPMK